MRFWKKIGLLGFYFLVILICLEILLRVWEHFRHCPEFPASSRFTVNQKAEDLGWKLKPGLYSFPKTSGTALTTIWPNGSRATSPEEKNQGPALLGLGCSYLFGWGLSDSETFFYQLQTQMPQYRFLNFGTPGYGTYQSLLRLKHYADETAEPPALAMYFWMEDHNIRNAAPNRWKKILKIYGQDQCAATPFCRMDAKGHLKKFPPEAWPHWPLENYSHLVKRVKDFYFEFAAYGETDVQPRNITEALMKEMHDFCREKKIPFGIVLLEGQEEMVASLSSFLKEQAIPYQDCSLVEESLKTETRLPEDNHPNALLNRAWAGCVEKGMKKFLA